jgi:hypothetical protein
VQFQSGSSNGSEATSPALITVTLSAVSGKTVTVNYATADGTAAAGADYTASGGTITFTPGQTSKTINVPVINDASPESNETFILSLSGPTNAGLGTPLTHTYTINNDDTAAVIRRSGQPYEESLYSLIGNAYSEAASGDDILMLASDFDESLDFNRDIEVVLLGGYDAGFSSVTGISTVHGSVTISGGTVTVDNVAIQ